MSKLAFERKIEALLALRAQPDAPETLAQLRHALKERNNFLVAKAAALAGELSLHALVSDLIAAFDRFLIDAAQSDPRCRAKNAIAQALKELGHSDPAFFLRGMAHVQPEPVWGGQQDTAAGLRGNCALALVGCALEDNETLTQLVNLLADPERSVRIDAVRAIAQFASVAAQLILRTKAIAGDAALEVTGQCFTSLLEAWPSASVAFVARYARQGDPDLRMEALAALSACHDESAVQAVLAVYAQERDPDVRRATAMALGASPHTSAMEFLLALVRDGSNEEARAAITALAEGRFRERVRDTLGAVLKSRRDRGLKAVFQKAFAELK